MLLDETFDLKPYIFLKNLILVITVTTFRNLAQRADTYWSFVWVPLYRRAGETLEDLRKNNRHYSLWVDPQLIMPLLPLDKLSDVWQPPREVMTLLTLAGGHGWKCVFLAPCCVSLGTRRFCEVLLQTVQTQSLASCCSHSLKSTWGSFCPWGLCLCPSDPHKQMSHHWAFS